MLIEKTNEFNTGERLYLEKTEAGEESVREHLDRYQFARERIEPGWLVIDAACGSGYGSAFLAERAREVIGLDASEHALIFAKENYSRNNLYFLKADLGQPLAFPDDYCDAIVSFETLEHVFNQENMLREFKRILKPGGFLIISSPDREVITERAGTENKFHVRELSKKELLDIVSRYFRVEELYGQTKYSSLSWWKKLIKIMAKLDALNLKRPIIRWLGLKLFVHKHFSPIAYSPLERVRPDSPNDYYVLIAVCRK